jgi:hypothetical protein
MQKITISVLCLLALLLNGWLASTHWVRAGVERELAKVIIALQERVQVTHGPVNVNLWDRSVAIPDIVMQPRGVGGPTVTVAGVTAFSVDRTGGTVVAGRVTINELRISGQLPSNAASRAHYFLPTATLTGVSARVDSAVSGAEGLNVTSLHVPELKMSMILQTKTLIDQTLSKIEVGAVKDGKIGRVSVGHSAITTTLIGEAPLLLEITDGNLADLDVGLIAGLFDGIVPAASEVSRYKTVLRYGSTGAMTVYRDGAVAATCSSLELSNVAVDASRSGNAVRALKSVQPAAGQRLSRKQEQAMQDAVDTIYENVAADWLKMNGLTWAPGTLPVGRGQGSIATLQMRDLIDGKLEQLHINGLDAITFPDMPTFSPSHDSVVVGRSSFHKLNLVELTRLPARLLTSSMKLPSAAILWPLAIRLFEGIEAERVFITTGLQPEGMGIERLSAAWGPVIGQTPTSGQARGLFSLPVASSPVPINWLSSIGLSRVHVNFEGQWKWQEATKSLDLGLADFSIADVGSVHGKLHLANVSRLALIARPDLMPAAIQAITFGSVDLVVRDQGVLAMLGKDPTLAATAQRTMAQFTASIGRNAPSGPFIKASETAIPGTSPANRTIQLTAQPGQRLMVTLAPIVPISIGSVLSSGKSGDDLLRMLATQIDARATMN